MDTIDLMHKKHGNKGLRKARCVRKCLYNGGKKKGCRRKCKVKGAGKR